MLKAIDSDKSIETKGIEPGSIHVWLVEQSIDSSRSNSRRESKKYLTSSTWLNKIIGHYPELSQYNLAYLPNGRPLLNKGSPAQDTEQKEYFCSASHTERLGVYAISRGFQIGIDTELIRPRKRMHNLHATYFHNREHKKICQTSTKGRADTFFLYWTLKEAHAKLTTDNLLNVLESRDFSDLDKKNTQKWVVLQDSPGFAYWYNKYLSNHWIAIALNNLKTDTIKDKDHNLPAMHFFKYTEGDGLQKLV